MVLCVLCYLSYEAYCAVEKKTKAKLEERKQKKAIKNGDVKELPLDMQAGLESKAGSSDAPAYARTSMEGPPAYHEVVKR